MRAIIFGLAVCLFAPHFSSFANEVTPPEDGDCDGQLNPIQRGLEEGNSLMKRLRAGKPNLPVANPFVLERVTIPLMPYMNSLGLGTQPTTAIPINGPEDISLGPVDKSKIKTYMKIEYPLDEFAIGEHGQKIALHFVNMVFAKHEYEKRAPHLFLAQITADKQLRHIDELVLPNEAHATRSHFVNDDNRLVVEGVWSDKSDGLRSDLYLYDLRFGKPNLLYTLSDKIKADVIRIAPIDSSDTSALYFVAQIAPSAAGGNFALLRVDKKTGEVELMIETTLSSSLRNTIESMEYDDERRGYVAIEKGGVSFKTKEDDIQISNNGTVSSGKINLADSVYRSSGSAWLLMKDKRSPNLIEFVNELDRQSYVFNMPVRLDYGHLTQVSGGYVYSERNHPNYAEYLLSPDGDVRELIKRRLVHSKAHATFLGGVSMDRQFGGLLEIIPFELK